MNAGDFLRTLRRIGREDGVMVRHDANHGKGSHGRVYYGAAYTTLPGLRKEVRPGLLNAMLRDLGISRERWERE